MTDLRRLAAAYPPEAAHTPVDERQRLFTDLQRQAWDLRFGGGSIASEATVIDGAAPRRIYREPYYG